jgi:hypothetical protein
MRLVDVVAVLNVTCLTTNVVPPVTVRRDPYLGKGGGKLARKAAKMTPKNRISTSRGQNPY